MATVGKIFVVLLITIAAAIWLRAKVMPQPAAVAVAIPTVSVQKPSATQTAGYEEITGTAIMDDSAGLPAVPYIKYQPNGQGVITKQLIFVDSRGCYPSAGDIPCVPSAAGYAYPTLVTGQRIRVEGYLRENRFLVEHIEVIG
jgi:hypothetical protein